jgi:hypothetical protein
MNIKLDPARRLARKKAMTGCWIGSSAQSRKSFRLKAPVAASSAGQDVTALVEPLGPHVASAVSSTAGADKTLRPALSSQISSALLLAAQAPLELLNGKNVLYFQWLRCFIQGHTESYFVRLINIDIYYFFWRNEAVMYKKTSDISIFSCITKP